MKLENNDDTLVSSVLMGYQIKASYIGQEVKNYCGNPIIEALPKIYTNKQVIEMLTRSPKVLKENIDSSAEVRLHHVEQIRGDFLQPLPLHINIELSISRMIRTGYVGRNPTSPVFARKFVEGFKDIVNEKINRNKNRSTASSNAIIGISGIGKSTAVEEVLLLYPQVIIHTGEGDMYPNLGYLKQIVWLKIECPFNGSRSSLCKNFFKAVDSILKTDYLRKFRRLTEAELIERMAHVASLHCVGLLVIDEIQRMNKGEEGQKTLDYFVELHNQLGVPLLFVGTYKSMHLFDKLLANGRRISQQGMEIVDRMKNDNEYEFFINRLWEFQYLRNKTILTEKIKNTIYNETQGITSLIVNLFIHVQFKAIIEGQEKISESLIKKTALKNFKVLQPFLKALRIGNITDMKKYDDLQPEWLTVDDILKQLPTTNLYGNINNAHSSTLNKNIKFIKLKELANSLGLDDSRAVELVSDILNNKEIAESEVFKKVAERALLKQKNESIEKQPKKKNNGHSIEIKGILPIIGINAKKNKLPILEELEKNKFIAPFDEFTS